MESDPNRENALYDRGTQALKISAGMVGVGGAAAFAVLGAPIWFPIALGAVGAIMVGRGIKLRGSINRYLNGKGIPLNHSVSDI